MAKRKRRRRRTSLRSCPGINGRTGRLKKGWRFRRGKGRCPIRARKGR